MSPLVYFTGSVNSNFDLQNSLNMCGDILSIEASIAFLEVLHMQQDQSHFLDDMRTEQAGYFCRCYCKRLIALVTGVSRGLSQSTGSFPVSGFLYLDVVKMVHS